MVLVLAVLAATALPAPAQVQLTRFPAPASTFATPYHVAGAPGDPTRVFVVEAGGTIRLVKGGVTQPTLFLDASAEVWSGAEGGCECGMFSMAPAPDYASSGLFYVFYTRDVPGTSPSVQPFHDLVVEEVRRSATDPDVADPASRRVVLEIPHRTASNHNGGQLAFGPDGLLYLAVGDGGNTPQLAQDLTSRLGKLLRIDPRDPAGPDAYAIPADNPFADGAGPNADEVYAYGLRNPYRFSFDRLTGAITIGDVGGGSLEEVDHAAAGGASAANYGWPCFEGTQTLQTTGFCSSPLTNHTPPVHEYPNPAAGPAAVSAGFVARDLTLPSLLGRFVYADTYTALGAAIHAIDLTPAGSSGNGPVPGLNASGIVSFGEDACGHVYVVEIGGPVSRIEPAGGTTACAPQLPPQPPQQPPAPVPAPEVDTSPPALQLDLRKARRAGKRRKARVIVRCAEACTVTGSGRIVLRGKDIRLDPDSRALPAGARGALVLGLSRAAAKRLRRTLAARRRATAVIRIDVVDSAGNRTRLVRRVRQKR